jgi:hypothetical protein
MELRYWPSSSPQLSFWEWHGVPHGSTIGITGNSGMSTIEIAA